MKLQHPPFPHPDPQIPTQQPEDQGSALGEQPYSPFSTKSNATQSVVLRPAAYTPSQGLLKMRTQHPHPPSTSLIKICTLTRS